MVKRKVGLSPDDLMASLSTRLAGSLSTQFLGQKENVTYLMDMLLRTVDKGESNSLLVLGPRGSGKTSLIKHVLRLASERSSWAEDVVIVKLSGHIQTDDKVALRDITKQLNLENVVGNKVFGSFAEHLSFLLASLKTGDTKSSKPIIFVLDEFDSFCSHKNQTLLYNLFDVAQSRAVPICVLGISSQIDVTELLEKRVKSRFSHRHLYIWLPEDSSKIIELAGGFLKLDIDGAKDWNKSVEELLESEPVVKFFENYTKVNKSVKSLKKLLYLAVIEMVQEQMNRLNLDHLMKAKEGCAEMTGTDSLTALLKDLSITEICLLISIKHILQIYDSEPFNFEMVYHEFVKFKRRKMPTLCDERSVIMKCWENLLDLELISPKSGGRGGGQQEQFSLNSGQIPAPSLVIAVEKLQNCPTEVIQWLHSSHHTASH